jgi:hypothetical protein
MASLKSERKKNGSYSDEVRPKIQNKFRIGGYNECSELLPSGRLYKLSRPQNELRKCSDVTDIR